jgi:hypothetical protein
VAAALTRLFKRNIPNSELVIASEARSPVYQERPEVLGTA